MQKHSQPEHFAALFDAATAEAVREGYAFDSIGRARVSAPVARVFGEYQEPAGVYPLGEETSL